MVFWELTLGTAYFLGLKRTYRLALKIQRRLIKPKHQKIRQFLHRRTRAVFDVAIKVHRNVQQRDIEVGRNLGNWILRWLDRMKPSAQIRALPPEKPLNAGSTGMTKQVNNSSNQKTHTNIERSSTRGVDRESDRHLFTSARNIWPKHFPTITRMMRPPGSSIQTRHLSICGPDVLRPNYERRGFHGVIRKDIMQWMLRD